MEKELLPSIAKAYYNSDSVSALYKPASPYKPEVPVNVVRDYSPGVPAKFKLIDGTQVMVAPPIPEISEIVIPAVPAQEAMPEQFLISQDGANWEDALNPERPDDMAAAVAKAEKDRQAGIIAKTAQQEVDALLGSQEDKARATAQMIEVLLGVINTMNLTTEQQAMLDTAAPLAQQWEQTKAIRTAEKEQVDSLG